MLKSVVSAIILAGALAGCAARGERDAMRALTPVERAPIGTGDFRRSPPPLPRPVRPERPTQKQQHAAPKPKATTIEDIVTQSLRKLVDNPPWK